MPLYLRRFGQSAGFSLCTSHTTTADILPVVHSVYASDARELGEGRTEIVDRHVIEVVQREFAVVDNDGDVRYLGTDHLTTCHVVVLRCQSATLLAHMDSAEVGDDGRTQMQTALFALSSIVARGSSVDMHLIGGFDDEEASDKLTRGILNDAAQCDALSTKLVTACVGVLNSTYRNGTGHPTNTSIAVDVRRGRVFAAKFDTRPCALPRRSARSLLGPQTLLNVFDRSTNCISVAPFAAEQNVKLYARYILEKDDLWILKVGREALGLLPLQNMSTSPAQESIDFVEDIRVALRYVTCEDIDRSTTLQFALMHDGLWARKP